MIFFTILLYLYCNHSILSYFMFILLNFYIFISYRIRFLFEIIYWILIIWCKKFFFEMFLFELFFIIKLGIIIFIWIFVLLFSYKFIYFVIIFSYFLIVFLALIFRLLPFWWILFIWIRIATSSAFSLNFRTSIILFKRCLNWAAVITTHCTIFMICCILRCRIIWSLFLIRFFLESILVFCRSTSINRFVILRIIWIFNIFMNICFTLSLW